MRSDGLLVIGPIDWNPEDWDYQTSDAAVEHILVEVKYKGAVNGFISVTGNRDTRHPVHLDNGEGQNNRLTDRSPMRD
jgi:hypothetical protein